jgi:hypothetical protein
VPQGRRLKPVGQSGTVHHRSRRGRVAPP